MADFAVAGLSPRETDRNARGLESGQRIEFIELRNGRKMSFGVDASLGIAGYSPAVKDDENHGFVHIIIALYYFA
jgi:hypothetical protein